MDDREMRRRFTEVYDANRMRVWSYVVSRAGRQIADEVVSETFVVAWRRFGDVPDPALPWLLAVARNVLRDSFRATVRRDSLVAELRSWTQHAELATADVGDTVTERLEMLRALATLAEDDREALILAAWQGLTPREAAHVTGCTSAAMRVRLHRARKRLGQALAAAPQPSASELPARASLPVLGREPS